jgi:preprotein translocase subunit YajC
LTGRVPCGLAKDPSVVSIVSLLPIILIGGMLILMMNSSKKKQQATQRMQNQMEPGAGVRTIGGMYALVKEVREDSVELEVAPGVHAIYAKNAIAVVMDGVEYNRIVHGDDEDEDELAPVYDEESAEDSTEDEIDAAETPIVLDKAPLEIEVEDPLADQGTSTNDKAAPTK